MTGNLSRRGRGSEGVKGLLVVLGHDAGLRKGASAGCFLVSMLRHSTIIYAKPYCPQGAFNLLYFGT